METNIPERYQKTDIGVIPKDWELKRLGEIAVVSSGGTPNRSNPSYWDGNIPWITTSQIDFNTIISSNEFITELGLRNSAAKMYVQDTLLMAMYGQGKTRGKVAILGIDATINQACAAITLNKDIYNNYVFFYLARNYEEIRKLSNTGNQENLNGNIIKSIFVPIPPLPEQKTIAQSLNDVDALIALCDRLITKKRHIKQGTMQQLLTGKKRLPSFSGEWEVEGLGNIALLERGKFSARPRNDPKFFGGDVPFIQTGDVTKSNGIITTYNQSLNHQGLRVSKLFPSNTLFFTIAANIGDIGIASFETACPDSLIAITPQAKVDKKWLFHALKSRKKSFEGLATQNAQLNINLEKLKPYLLPVPPISEQKAIAQILSDMDTEIAALEQKRNKYKAIKQGMMQELLTGKTRLKFNLDD